MEWADPKTAYKQRKSCVAQMSIEYLLFQDNPHPRVLDWRLTLIVNFLCLFVCLIVVLTPLISRERDNVPSFCISTKPHLHVVLLNVRLNMCICVSVCVREYGCAESIN